LHCSFNIKKFAKEWLFTCLFGTDITWETFEEITANVLGGVRLEARKGLIDVHKKTCGWSLKTVKANKPYECRRVRLISGRHGLRDYNIKNPWRNAQNSGNKVLTIYNKKVIEAANAFKDVPLLALIRNAIKQEFVLFEEPLRLVEPRQYVWVFNENDNIEAFDRKGVHRFTFQPRGAQFTMVKNVPVDAVRFKINQRLEPIDKQNWIENLRLEDGWIQRKE
jgi:hypothetical protein